MTRKNNAHLLRKPRSFVLQEMNNSILDYEPLYEKLPEQIEEEHLTSLPNESDLKVDSQILLIYDVAMPVYQQELFRELLFRLGQSRLRTSVPA